VRGAFLQKLQQLLNRPDVDIWFADESGFEGDQRPRKSWDKKGRKTRVTGNGGHLRMNVIGMVCPRSAELFAIEASHSHSATYQAFLDQADKKNHLISKNNSYFDYGQCLIAQAQNHQLAQLTTDVLAALLARYKSRRAHLACDESRLVQQLCLQN
jgi:hypothetical protein